MSAASAASAMSAAGNTRADILRMFERGVDAANIADALGIPQVSVVAILCREGLWNAEQIAKYGPAVIEGTLAGYRAFEPQKETCERMGLKPEDYWIILNNSAEPQRGRKKGPEKALAKERRNAEVIALYLAGESRNDIAEACGIWGTTVRYILIDAGVYKGFGRRDLPQYADVVETREAD